jgi:hypothetical protein
MVDIFCRLLEKMQRQSESAAASDTRERADCVHSLLQKL